ncbi:MAG: 16S rRNA (adenine(1518)-N(6)/adenine(1519)-N(6))-dimethyltransferase RsmA [Methanocellales archaeon]|nr:16S rRNA (adenine(1518)-N(6)/adenine(1519)-N(6))-dimethyltransferase RsmA [Methanocellales archaeon]MDD3291411.1 16S rRNA (adenine(1518)-N(6)/adenine(1519)-N(6))-dimethyltransferase RsmA [Methanocellales archaeon]MDD5234699.1 16S rRNA (adenine(1518)-N(6)/adenine(1519)-N(6))-dimethyltransferase RsmA [Methanocellales archaeon]MDD5484950.1 16S rRNA (adenine(1518)-N(6)/adenine(1519)-N(6))-dimethyltransferase RsmA [Methanocellales archaeon]
MGDQHFLIDEKVIDRIIRYAELDGKETVLEIGAGTGNLTKNLAKNAANVIAIESDHRLVEVLDDLSLTNVKMIHGDALQVVFPKFDKVVSNLPYSISSDITFKLLKHDFTLGILMYQHEFAKRMMATTDTENYGRLSVVTQYLAETQILEIVPKTAFYPQAEVKSAIVRLVPRTQNLDRDFFLDFVAAMFTQRRKQMKNAILNAAHMLNLGDARKLIDMLPRDLMSKRPEKLYPEELAALSNLIYGARYEYPV